MSDRPDEHGRDGADVDDAPSDLEPTAAFELLAHETRLAAMRVLWEAREPLRFSEIADRAGISDTGNFNYHFGKLVGGFVREVGDRYALTRSGRQAMTAVLAGDVTEHPSFDPVTLEESCPYCDAAVELHHDADQLRVLCSSCSGTFEGERETLSGARDPHGTPNPPGTLSTFAFPPAGLRDRDPDTVLEAALSRLVSRSRDASAGVCPDCAGPVDRTAAICPDHDPEGICEACGSRFAGLVTMNCETCRNTHAGVLALVGLSDPRIVSFFADHGIDPLDPSWAFATAFLGVEERVRGTDPLDYEAAWTLGDETLRVRFDADGEISALTREADAGSRTDGD